MKLIIGFIVVFISTLAFAQPRDLTPSKRSKAFGKRDFRALSGVGLQMQLGATYLMTNRKNELIEATHANNDFVGNYMHDQFGKPGVYGEIGLMHFPKNRSKLSLRLKTVLVSYYDWGIGFKYFRGGENVSINNTGTNNSSINEFRLDHGNVYARFSLHKNIHFKKNRGRDKTNFFLDNSLGINVDYRLLDQPAPTSSVNYSPLHVQLHYGLGVGFKLKRGAYLIPGVRLPLLGYQSTNTLGTVIGKPSLHWFSSRYWPIMFHVKYMFVFEKKSKGCDTGITNEQDKNTQRNR